MPHRESQLRLRRRPHRTPWTPPNALDTGIGHALDALLAQQNADGHWVYELEADATIPAEYVLMVHYLGETPDLTLEARIARWPAAHPECRRRLAAVP
ncbi:hypothetical protein ACTMU2_12160 [Cupriavidus basilensis]